ncbi:MAG: FAD:protein FMN transferase [bacterium]
MKETRPLMGTMVEITAIGRDRARVREAVIKAFAEMKRIESLMSPYRKGSDIRRINRAAGKTPVKVDAEVIKLLSRSRKVSEKSGGAFDLTAAALGGIWSFDKKSPEIPSESEIKKTLKKVGFDLLVLDREKETAQLSLPGMRIHPGGIAKGYACDRAARLLAEEDVSMAMVNAGGDIRVLGRKINRPWKVGLQDPRDPRRIMAWIPVKNAAVATSGDYEKFFVKDGKRYCHIMDPGTGRPANVCRSATVITDEAWLADTLATAVFVLGPEEGLELVHEMDAKALVIDAAGETHLSPVLKGKVHWLQ